MSNEEVFLTKEGLAQLEEELKELKGAGRKELPHGLNWRSAMET